MPGMRWTRSVKYIRHSRQLQNQSSSSDGIIRIGEQKRAGVKRTGDTQLRDVLALRLGEEAKFEAAAQKRMTVYGERIGE